MKEVLSEADKGWYNKASEEVIEALQTDKGGLSFEEAAARLRTYGPNRLPEAAKQNPFIRFLKHFHNILIYVLLGSAVITAALGHFADTVVIVAVVIANAAIGFFQEGKAEKAMDAIRRMLALKASVLRNGKRLSVEGEALVPGDIVMLEAGDKIPADVRLIQVNGLQVQEAILTGESIPVEKNTHPVAVNAATGDRSCMAYSGTLVTSGLGRGVVVGTGADTEIGRISGMLSRVETLTTPLLKQMNAFARWITVLILLIASVLLAFGYFVGHSDFSEMFMAVVGLSVAAIPEGLPAVLTITLAVGVQAMARRNAIVRHLPAIETLGSVSVICTDKTGTLTRNEMMVASVVTATDTFSVDGNGYEPAGEVRLNEVPMTEREHPVLGELGRTAALCNDASLNKTDGEWKVEGDPMEGALLAMAGKLGVDIASNTDRMDTIPFDARHRFMATLNYDAENGAYVFVKGAPEQVMSMCAEQRVAPESSERFNEGYWHKKAEEIAVQGQRVLALALKPMNSKDSKLDFADVQSGLIMLGLVGLIDPPRSEAINAVAKCHTAGIRVKMITGDHKGTAAAIARKIGLQNSDKVLTGTELDDMDDAALAQAVLNTDIFARTSPEHKLRLVMALQSHGMTVAMTGDGVNDAPALKRADGLR
jgi:magnesium-transporting ATPase (P-type)